MSEYLAVLDRDPAALSHDDVLAGLVLAERLRSAADAWSLRALDALAREPASEPERQWVRSEVAVALRWSDRFACGRFALAERVVAALPATLEALSAGRLALGHVQAIADQSLGLDEQSTRDLEEHVLTYAESHTIADTRRKVKRALLRLDPQLAAERMRQGVADRAVWAAPDEVPGLARLGALLPADGAAEVMAAVEVLASRPVEPGDTRTKTQRRADALVELGRTALLGGCTHCGLPARGRGPAVTVTVALSTLLGLDERAGELNGEPVPAELARALASDPNGTWRRLVTDGFGEVLEYGRSTYRPPALLREFVQLRDGHCRFPGCRRAARACDLDHVTAWEDGGTTDPWNLAALCERHHYLKRADTGWRLVLWPDGTCVWTTPTGQSVLVGPAAYPVDTTADPYLVVPNDTAGPPRDPAGPPLDGAPRDPAGPPRDPAGPPRDPAGPPRDPAGPPLDGAPLDGARLDGALRLGGNIVASNDNPDQPPF